MIKLRIKAVSKTLNNYFKKYSNFFEKDNQKFVEREYWENRANKFSELTVGRLDWDKNQLDKETKKNLKLLIPFFIKYFSKKSVILEVGCGVGRLSYNLLPYVKKIVGIDISRRLLEIAKQKKRNIENIDFIYLKKEGKFPLKNEQFDGILTFTVLQHIVNDNKFKRTLSEISRVIKKGGILISYENTATSSNFRKYRHIKFRNPEQYFIEMYKLGFILEYCKIMPQPKDVIKQRHTLFIWKRISKKT